MLHRRLCQSASASIGGRPCPFYRFVKRAGVNFSSRCQATRLTVLTCMLLCCNDAVLSAAINLLVACLPRALFDLPLLLPFDRRWQSSEATKRLVRWRWCPNGCFKYCCWYLVLSPSDPKCGAQQCPCAFNEQELKKKEYLLSFAQHLVPPPPVQYCTIRTSSARTCTGVKVGCRGCCAVNHRSHCCRLMLRDRIAVP